ncbi:hypothetical protein QJS66_11995 [Kocuria rhizophila]|nr:hypothetical protein QJS66_11995 [Kocuria rhizophila]
MALGEAWSSRCTPTTVSTSGKAPIGLPECRLGLLPGLGRCPPPAPPRGERRPR